MNHQQKVIVATPLVFSCILSVLIFLQVILFASDLTHQAEELLFSAPVQFFVSTFFLLIPNLLLSFFLFSYAESHPDETRNLSILCGCSLAVAMLLSGSMWIFIYTDSSFVPALVFGFPVTYFFGVCIGYVVGIVATGLK